VKTLSEQQHDEDTFRTFEDLEVYKKAREFRKRMYGVARRLPDFEKYELGRDTGRASAGEILSTFSSSTPIHAGMRAKRDMV
jgi:hypothetical protein